MEKVDIFALIDELQEEIELSPTRGLSKNKSVDAKIVMEIIEDIKQALHEELDFSRRVVGEKDQILNAAQAQADEIIKRAKLEAEELVKELSLIHILFPSQIESVLMAMSEVEPHYEIVVTRENYMDRIEVKVEVSNPALLDKFTELEQLRGKIRHNLYKTLNIDAKVTLVSGGTLKRFEGKAKRVTDLRNL